MNVGYKTLGDKISKSKKKINTQRSKGIRRKR